MIQNVIKAMIYFSGNMEMPPNWAVLFLYLVCSFRLYEQYNAFASWLEITI